jgi:hypothetical protein
MSGTALIPGAQLWIGFSPTLMSNALAYCQKLWCPYLGCKQCSTCIRIANGQHHALLWLKPQKNTYARAQLDPLFKQLSFARAPDDIYLIVIESADLLSSINSNALLKSLEEPPPGYHFLLLAQREELILPTLKSRCIITKIETEKKNLATHRLLELFKQPATMTLDKFIQEFDKTSMTEYETRILVDILLEYWLKQYSRALSSNQITLSIQAQDAINILVDSLEKLPMPGSTQLFWRNLFLRMSTIAGQ